MSNSYLYSIVLELQAVTGATVPATTGHQAHALFLDLVGQVDPVLAARLHDEQNYRPFTVSPLLGGQVQGEMLNVRPGQPCRIRLTLLDGGSLWHCLNARFLAPQPLLLRVGAAEFRVTRILATPTADSEGWSGFTTWAALVATPPRRYVTLRFVTPTAFNLGDKRFTLFPTPRLVWESFLRVWNNYAPVALHLDKVALGAFLDRTVAEADYTLHTAILHYPKHVQKGFIGSCTYVLREQGPKAAQVAALAEFARYAGVGYKTTMGMGQVRAEATGGER